MVNTKSSLVKIANQLLKSFSDPIYIIDKKGIIIWTNPSFLHTYGWEVGEINFSPFMPNYLLDEYQELQRRIMYGGSIYGYESSRYTKDGSLLNVLIDFLPVYSDIGEIDGYALILKSGSKQKKLEKELMETNEKYELIANNTSDIVMLVDPNGFIRYVSPSLESITGYKQEEYEGKKAFSIIHPDDIERVSQLHTFVFGENRPVDLEYRALRKDGMVIDIESRVMPVLDDDKQAEYSVIVARDVSERKTKEKQLEYIMNNIQAAIWSTDNNFSTLNFCSTSTINVIGISSEDFSENPRILHKMIDSNHMKPFEIFDINRYQDTDFIIDEFQIIFNKNEKRWIRCMAHAIRNAHNKVIRIDGIFLDITSLKEYENKYKLSEQRFKALFDNHIDGVFTLNTNGEFINCNISMKEILELGNYLIDKLSFIDFVSDQNKYLVEECVKKVITLNQPQNLDIIINTLQKNPLMLNVTFIPVIENNETIGIHGIAKDITLIHETSNELKRNKERYQKLNHSINNFAHDLRRVMKVPDIERRLLKEINTILGLNDVSVIQVDRTNEKKSKIPYGKPTAIEEDLYLKIWRNSDKIILLKIDNHTLNDFDDVEISWLETIIQYVSTLYENLQIIEDLSKQLESEINTNSTPQWMLRLLFNISEKERQYLSSDLHDSALQDQIIWYRRLETLLSNTKLPIDIFEELSQISEGLLDVIHQIRITCNELRPPLLAEMGLIEALESLISFHQLYSDYTIDFHYNGNCDYINEEKIMGVYRVFQELLNNATKHSKATDITLSLEIKESLLELLYKDNGIGMDLALKTNSYQHLGISGIKTRIQSMEGEVVFHSSPNRGLEVKVILPI
ncbi:PAS domain S-box protein [Bacillus massilinigeriensis]|uniref:PAS domain S-box protein n=1 Tax=Bacillus massilionigeriensis TaxID=1805475 RepID=UPI00096AF8CF|nr:PAS domain S-box protein [Bacillus massilionigeriensis]